MDSLNSLLTPFAFLVFIGLILLLLSVGHLRARWPAPIEEGKTPIYTGWAGGTVGMVQHRGPLINFRVYDTFLVIDGLTRVVVEFEHIDRVELKKWWPGIGSSLVHIVHHQPKAPTRIRLSVSDPERVKMLIDARLAQSKAAPSRIG